MKTKKNDYRFSIHPATTSQAVVRSNLRLRRPLPFKKMASILLLTAAIIGTTGAASTSTVTSSQVVKADIFTDTVCVSGNSGQASTWGDSEERFGGLGGSTKNMMDLSRKASPTELTRPSANAVTESVDYRLTAYEKYGSNYPVFTTWTPAYETGDFLFAGVDKTGGLGTGDDINSGSTQGSETFTAADSRMIAADIGRCTNLGGIIESNMANTLTMFPRLILSGTSTMYSASTDVSLTNETSPLHFVLDGLDEIVINLRDAIFIPFMLPLVLIGAIWVAYVGIIKRKAMQAVQSSVWMVMAIALGVVFLAQPTFIAKFVDDTVSQFQATINNGMAVAAPTDELCQATGDMASKREASCTMWKASVYNVWEQGQFGGYADDTTDPRGILNNPDYSIQYGNESVTATSWGQFQLDRQATGMALQESEVAYAQLVAMDNSGWAGGSGMSQIGAALMMNFTVPVHSIVPFVFAFIQLGYQLMMIMAVIVSPFFFLLGIIPNWGRRVLVRFAELLVIIAVKRIVTTFVLAAYFVFYSIIATTPVNPLLQTVLVAVLAVATFRFRSWMLGMTTQNINFGGNKSFGLPGGKAAAAAAGVGGMVAGGLLAAPIGALVGSLSAHKAARSEANGLEGKGEMTLGSSPTADAKPRDRSTMQQAQQAVSTAKTLKGLSGTAPAAATPAPVAAPASPTAAPKFPTTPEPENVRVAPQRREAPQPDKGSGVAEAAGAAVGLGMTATGVGALGAGAGSAGTTAAVKAIQPWQ